jgi:hypothetical protein
MLNYYAKSLSPGLKKFRSFLKIGSIIKFTKRAFEQAPKKISPKIFKHVSRTMNEEFYTDDRSDLKTWEGFRLLAIDASRIHLPRTRELKAYFGETKNQATPSMLQARCSVLYDVENNYVVDGELEPTSKYEHRMALSHLTHCKPGDLILCARSYTSHAFIKHHVINNLDYAIRLKLSFSKPILDFKKSKKKSQIVSITSNRRKNLSIKDSDVSTPIKVRLIRIELPKGQVEILMTSLLDKKNYPNHIFQSLYNKQWGKESFYNELKTKLTVEHFSGYNRHSILQDFHATLFISNIETQIVSELEDEIVKKQKQIQLDFKSNTYLSYGFLKNRVIELFFSKNSMKEPLNELKELLFQNSL